MLDDIPNAWTGFVRAEVRLWWARTDEADDRLRDLLVPEERDRHDRLLLPEDRARFLVGRCLARLVVGRFLDVEPQQAPLREPRRRGGGLGGKPLVDHPRRLEISVSHSGDQVIVAATVNGPLGVDVERLADDAVAHSLAQRVLSTRELKVFERADAVDRADVFTSYWVRKEAVVKATGDGLAAPLRQLTVSAPTERPQVIEWHNRPLCSQQLQLHVIEAAPGYRAAVAVFTGATSRPVVLRAPR